LRDSGGGGAQRGLTGKAQFISRPQRSHFALAEGSGLIIPHHLSTHTASSRPQHRESCEPCQDIGLAVPSNRTHKVLGPARPAWDAGTQPPAHPGIPQGSWYHERVAGADRAGRLIFAAPAARQRPARLRKLARGFKPWTTFGHN